MEKKISNITDLSLKTDNILIVDDVPQNLQLLSDILTEQGYEVRAAINGRVALNAVANQLPDLILLDIRMPDMDGFEICRRLKTDNQTRDVPIIFISALGEPDDKVRAFWTGGVDYITKPFNEAEVMARVKTHLHLRRLQKEQDHYRHLIEERIRMQTEELKESETRYRQLVNELPVGLFRITMEDGGRILMTNPATAKMFGYETVEEIMEVPLLEFYKNLNQGDRVLSILSSEGAVQGLELEFKKRDGTLLIGKLIAHLLRDSEGKPLCMDGTIEDITERKALERQFRHAQKMESIGTLAGGIAHDFNNILGAVMGYTELVIGKVEKTDYNVQDYLKNVYQASLRAKDLVNQILQFSRHADTSFKLVAIRLIVKEVIKLLQASFPATIEIKQNIQLGSEKIFADASQIHQVIMNLCTNAFHAMREKSGILTVELLKKEVVSSIACHDCQIVPGFYAVLIIQDTGCGMNNQTIQRIFEPYFTTKEYDEGTGLGLAVTNGIVKNHKGGIRVESTPDVGSIFTVYFPLIQTHKETEEHDLSPVEGGNECILYVDDEAFFLDLSKKLLMDLGYEVVTVNRGSKALESFSSQPDRFDLLITDQTMPNMTGIELARQIHKIRPDLPIIICTGFSEAVQGKTVEQIGVSQILYKPATKRELATAIRKVLNHEMHSDH